MELRKSCTFDKKSDASIRFSSVQEKYPELRTLPDNYKRVLIYLEVRSMETNGDTKAYTKRIAEAVMVSESTVKRAFRRLEKDHFIARHTIRKFDENTRSFWADRTIRCFRVFMYHGCQVKKVKWTKDNRPKTDVEFIKKRVDNRWTFDPLEDARALHEQGVHQFQDGIPLYHEWDHKRDGIILDGNIEELYEHFKFLQSIGSPNGFLVLGYDKSSDKTGVDDEKEEDYT